MTFISASHTTPAGFLIETVVSPLLVATIAALAVGARRVRKKYGPFLRDLLGEPARPGVEARPGLVERMATTDARSAETQTQIGEIRDQVAEIRAEVRVVHHEVRPNGGASMKDQLTRLDAASGPTPPPVADPEATP